MEISTSIRSLGHKLRVREIRWPKVVIRFLGSQVGSGLTLEFSTQIMSTDTYMVKYRLNVGSVAIRGHGMPFRRCRNHSTRENKNALPFGISRPRDNYISSARDTQRFLKLRKFQLEASRQFISSPRATQKT